MDHLSLLREQRGPAVDDGHWVAVCELDEIIPGTGVAAMIEGEQVAIVRPSPGPEVYALSNFDPFSKAFVLSRGIVGDRKGVLKIASPIYKQNFSLTSGECLDDPTVSVPTYPARVRQGKVEVCWHPARPGAGTGARAKVAAE